jgi:hypothetical protein
VYRSSRGPAVAGRKRSVGCAETCWKWSCLSLVDEAVACHSFLLARRSRKRTAITPYFVASSMMPLIIACCFACQHTGLHALGPAITWSAVSATCRRLTSADSIIVGCRLKGVTTASIEPSCLPHQEIRNALIHEVPADCT